MIFELPLTIPAGTPASAPAEASIKVWSGILHRVIFVMPAGCRGLVHASLHDGGHQFAPSTEGQTFHGDRITFDYTEHYDFRKAKNRVTIKGWSPGTTYDHKVTAYLCVLKEEYVDPRVIFTGIRDSLYALLRRGRIIM